jgi:hypothetical protein
MILLFWPLVGPLFGVVRRCAMSNDKLGPASDATAANTDP